MKQTSVQPAPTFQELIARLQSYWTAQGCLAWSPHHEMVGAGTCNPATLLRALGPEPWNVCYVEPSFRPDDGRFAENPNRMQMHHQYQVILQPPPSNPQELYLGSLEAIGLRLEEHDVRFVEDNWESPALAAWGLGWEVWLDGMEVTQFTYFQQAGGLLLDPPACELTYGLERLAMFLQRVDSVWDLTWDGKVGYADILKEQEIEFCRYDFEVAEIPRMQKMFELFEEEALHCIAAGLPVPAHDYVLRCSHTFNVLDARGAVGLSERVKFFGRMRDMSRKVAELYAEQRERLGYPLLRLSPPAPERSALPAPAEPGSPQTLLFELGVEELAAFVPPLLIEQLAGKLPAALRAERLEFSDVYVSATPRRLVARIEGVSHRQPDAERWVKGPARAVAEKNPQALAGFCKKNGVEEKDLIYKEEGGGEFAFARLELRGRPAPAVLAEILPRAVRELQCESSMRWLASAQHGEEAKLAFNRPIRWIVALFGREVVPFRVAGVESGRVSIAGRWEASPSESIADAADYLRFLDRHGIALDVAERRESIAAQASELSREAGGKARLRAALLDEVTQLVEKPSGFLCSFDPAFLALPREVIVSTMEKHTRCFALEREDGSLLPRFIGVRNGTLDRIDVVRWGYERLIAARFSDARFFVEEDGREPLQAYLERVKKLIFHAKVGSMFEKGERLRALCASLIEGDDPILAVRADRAALARAAELAKADLGTRMVTEMTSLQGEMGRVYALRSGESEKVANAIAEQYLPRSAGDALPCSPEGLVLSLADRLDTLIALFSVGAEPTGSADPFGLRREAQGILACLTGSGTSISLKRALSAAQALLPTPGDGSTIERVIDFVTRRFEILLRDQGMRADVVRAVLGRCNDDPARARSVAEELSALLQTPAAGRERLKLAVEAHLRCRRLLNHAGSKGVEIRADIPPGGLREPEELALEKELARALADAAPLRAGGGSAFKALFTLLDGLTPAITRFFDKVLVMAEDPELRAARLSLVAGVASLLDGEADLEKLEGFSSSAA